MNQRGWENNITMDFRNWDGGMEWIELPQDRTGGI